jgi:hypothetical protein
MGRGAEPDLVEAVDLLTFWGVRGAGVGRNFEARASGDGAMSLGRRPEDQRSNWAVTKSHCTLKSGILAAAIAVAEQQ